LADIEGDFPFDEAVIEGRLRENCLIRPSADIRIVMPKGTKVLSAESYGNSAWTITGRVSVLLPDGTPKRYFLKVRRNFI
jgi:protein-ribulosamine 3-kinase